MHIAYVVILTNHFYNACGDFCRSFSILGVLSAFIWHCVWQKFLGSFRRWCLHHSAYCFLQYICAPQLNSLGQIFSVFSSQLVILERGHPMFLAWENWTLRFYWIAVFPFAILSSVKLEWKDFSYEAALPYSKNQVGAVLKHRGYIGLFAFDEKTNLFYGEVSNSSYPISFEGRSLKSTKEAFKDAVNGYLEWCKKYDKEPKNLPAIDKSVSE